MNKENQQEFNELRKLYVNSLSKVPYYATFWEDCKIEQKVFKKGESYKVIKEDKKYYYLQHTSSSIEMIPVLKKWEEKIYAL